MNKLIILVFWMLAHILLYCAHTRFIEMFPSHDKREGFYISSDDARTLIERLGKKYQTNYYTNE